MLQSLEIRNFKSIKGHFFPLRNLNLLLGLNGMGKSSFIQTLLMLRQSNELEGPRRLSLNGTFTTIGSSKDALYQYSKNEDLRIAFVTNHLPVNLTFQYEPETDYFKVKSGGESLPTLLPDLRRIEGLFSENFQYLNANRQEPTSINPKNYSLVINSRNLGNKGQYTSHFIEVYSGEEIVFDNLLHPQSYTTDSLTNETITNRTLINQINLWMGEISPGVNVRTTSISSEFVLLEFVYKQPNFGNTNRYSPTNVGFGISYVLPVVTALLSARPGELIIIENPESHIHPRGQAELGKLIALTAMNDVQVIVETHSDHILNGIRVSVKEKDISRDKVIAFYFEKVVAASEQYSKISNIEIDENGELSEYPNNLLDEWSNQLVKLV